MITRTASEAPTLKRRIRHALSHTPMFDTLYSVYLLAFRHACWKYRLELREYYRPFIPKNSLVFDIGANQGETAHCFLGLGAGHVIAVEPVPNCLPDLRELGESATIIPYAVGARNGIAKMHISTQASCFSTMSDEWLHIARKANRFDDVIWDQEIVVPVITLDNLMAQYGRPDFIKIDVEGFESAVLEGLSVLPCPLNFEFNSEFPHAVTACLSKPCLANAEFNFAVDNHLRLREWVDLERLINLLSGTAGEIFARPLSGIGSPSRQS